MGEVVTINGTTYTHFPLSEDVFRGYYGKLNKNFYYIAPGSVPVLLGKYADNGTTLRNGNDNNNIIGELPDDNNKFVYTYIFRDNDVSRSVWRSNPYIYYTTTIGGRKRRKTNRKKSKRRKTKKRKPTRRR